MKLIFIKLLLFLSGVLAVFSVDMLFQQKIKGCSVAAECSGSLWLKTCYCADENCGGCFRRKGERGCGKCAKCNVEE
jgi:hypothetical protein